jgi:hypothetical protein
MEEVFASSFFYLYMLKAVKKQYLDNSILKLNCLPNMKN